MLEIEYSTTTAESANATLDFMTNRPILLVLFKFMQVSCILLCLAFAYTLYYNAIRPQDILAVLLACIWLFYYKKINRWAIGSGLKLRKFDNIKCLYKIDDKSILYQLQSFPPQNIKWKKLKFVLKNKDGYIIPLTGIANAGKFLWLPLRSLQNPDVEQQFLDLVTKFKLKIKSL